ncbi:MAG: DMT family transporter, partial [Acidimicrobiia bacterium]|nr:DMT family transporter [Acidimicrobiia bacterium]
MTQLNAGSMMRRGVVRCALAAVLFGVSAPAASRLADDLGPFSLAGLLYVGAAAAVLPVVGRSRPTAAAWRRSRSRLALAVFVGGAVGPVLLATGLGYVSAATASLLLNLELVFTTIVAALAFREHIGGRVAAGTALVALAGVTLAWSGDAQLRWGALLIAAACVCWAVDNSVTAALDDLAPAHITLAKGVVAGGANLAIGVVLDGGPPAATALGALAVGALGYGLSITLWVAGARDLGAARAQLVFATAPFVGAVVAWTVLAEPASWRQLIALVVAAVGVSFVIGSAHFHEHHHHPTVHDHEHVHDDKHHDHDRPAGADGARRHQHAHAHRACVHRHPHVPDL